MELNRKTELKADFALLMVTACWGVSYVLMDIALDAVSAFELNAMRFLIAFAIVAIYSWKDLKTASKSSIRAGILIGCTLSLVYVGATFGVMYTTLSKAAFLCCTTVFFTPFFEWVIFRKRPKPKIALAVLICVIGIAMLTLKEDFSLNMHDLKGDLLSLLAGIAYGLDLALMGHEVGKEEVNAYHVGIVSLGVCGLINLGLCLVFENPAMPQTKTAWFCILFLAIFCTGFSFIAQPIAQQYTEASHVGLIFALEPVFAGIVAFLIVHEVLTLRGYIGEALMVFSLILMEVEIPSVFRRRN